MKSKTILCAITAMTLGFGSLSYAQGFDRDRGGHRGPPQGHGHDQRHDQRDAYRGGHDRDVHDYGRRNDRNFYSARGPEFHRGGHIPPQYRARQYVVNDWRGHHLNAPARGHQWVQVGSDYVLVAIATGVIASLILNN